MLKTQPLACSKTYLSGYHVFSIVQHHLPFENQLQLLHGQQGESIAQQSVAHVTKWEQRTFPQAKAQQ